LPLSLEAANSPSNKLDEDALLDTGATACAISLDIASKLQLSIEETEELVVRTAVLNQNFPVKGKVHLNMRWRDEHGNRGGTKIWVFVVYGLSKSVLLSHDFTHRHPEVWAIARAVPHVAEEINVSWFNKASKKQQEAEEDFLKRMSGENKARADAEQRERLAELERILGNTIQNPTTGSSAGSSAGSLTGSSTASTFGSASGSRP
jgi:hypothetical protein